MTDKELEREITRYELNMPYPLCCFPGKERRKYAVIFMALDRAQKTHKSERRRFV